MKTSQSFTREAKKDCCTKALSLISRQIHLHEKPRIGIGIGSADLCFLNCFLGAENVFLRRKISDYLNNNPANITKMQPNEIVKMGEEIINKEDLSAIMFPGSTNTIAEPFWKKNASSQIKPNVYTANSFLKMAMVTHALRLGIPAIYSCDSSHYPVIALNGEISPSPNPPAKVIHDASYNTHNIIVTKGSWLHKMAEEVTPRKDNEGNAILTNVTSTHPLIPKKLPNWFSILAVAPDNSPSIFSIMPYMLGIVDHPEVQPSIFSIERAYSDNTANSAPIPDSDFDGINLWKKIDASFVKAAALSQNRTPVPQEKFLPRIQEILSTSKWQDFTNKQTAMNTPSYR